MISKRTTQLATLAFYTVIGLSLASCEEPDNSEENASSRYHMTSEFGGDGQLLAVQRSSDGNYSLVFKPWINPYVDPYGDEVLDREWVISAVGDGAYRISSRGVGEELSLDIVNDGVFDKLVLTLSEDVSGQHWNIETLDNGYCNFSTEFLGSEMVLDITSDTKEPMLTIRPVGDFAGQHWQLSQIGMTGILDSACTGVANDDGNVKRKGRYRDLNR